MASLTLSPHHQKTRVTKYQFQPPQPPPQHNIKESVQNFLPSTSEGICLIDPFQHLRKKRKSTTSLFLPLSAYKNLPFCTAPQRELLFVRWLLLLLLSHFSRVRLCETPQTAAHQAPPSLGFSRQEYWSGLPFPSPFVILDTTQFMNN